MCYRIALSAGPEELARRFGRRTELIKNIRSFDEVSAFAHAPYPVVTAHERLHYFRWGLIPYWTGSAGETVTVRNRTVNAPAETVFEDPLFRIPIRRKRCLVPVSAFFGWRHEQFRKVPFRITVAGHGIVALAGIYDLWYDRQTHRAVETFSIVTTEANELMRYVDNARCRMPVILRPEEEERWLDRDLSDDEIAALMRPYPAQEMHCEVVRGERSAMPDDAHILVPA